MARHYENLFAVESEIDATTEVEADERRSKRRKKQPDYFVRGKTFQKESENQKESDHSMESSEESDEDPPPPIVDPDATEARQDAQSTKTFDSEYLREMRTQTQLLGMILTELKKNNHYVKRLMKEETIVKRETQIDLEEVEAYDGSFFKANEIKSCDPNKFALQFVRKLKGQDYLAHHLCEPKQPTAATVDIIDPSVISLLKRHLSSRFEKYSWGTVRDSLNMAGRDRRKQLKRSAQKDNST